MTALAPCDKPEDDRSHADKILLRTSDCHRIQIVYSWSRFMRTQVIALLWVVNCLPPFQRTPMVEMRRIGSELGRFILGDIWTS